MAETYYIEGIKRVKMSDKFIRYTKLKNIFTSVLFIPISGSIIGLTLAILFNSENSFLYPYRFYLLFGIIIFFMIVLTRVNNHFERVYKQRFEDRERINISTIFGNSFSELSINEDEFLKLWKQIGKWINIEPQLLRPDDNFSGILSQVEGDITPDFFADFEDLLFEKCDAAGFDFYSEFEGRINNLYDFVKCILLKGEVQKYKKR